MSLSPDEKIYNLATVLKMMITDLRDKGSLDLDLANSLLEEMDLLRKF